jgi:protein transport protein SEC13
MQLIPQQVFISPPTLHSASVNSIAWAPYELGLILAAGSSDGTVSITEYANGAWSSTKLPGLHSIGVTAVSWAPASPAGPKAPSGYTKRIVSSGCDNAIRIWKCSSETGIWSEQDSLQAHTDWVRDVAWAPNLGLPRSVVASGGQDGQVFAWSEKPAGGWERKLVHDFKPQPVWKVSWSLTGNILAVSDGGNQVTLWKESLDGLWQQVMN